MGDIILDPLCGDQTLIDGQLVSIMLTTLPTKQFSFISSGVEKKKKNTGSVIFKLCVLKENPTAFKEVFGRKIYALLDRAHCLNWNLRDSRGQSYTHAC